ncbi:hypothetical protein WME81_24740 [Sorangium sp. So ce1078]
MVAATFQLAAQLTEVVHLADVDEHGHRLAVLVGDHRLSAPLEIDDGESAVAEGPRGESQTPSSFGPRFFIVFVIVCTTWRSRVRSRA